MFSVLIILYVIVDEIKKEEIIRKFSYCKDQDI